MLPVARPKGARSARSIAAHIACQLGAHVVKVKPPGANVHQGTHNLAAPLRVRVTAVGRSPVDDEVGDAGIGVELMRAAVVEVGELHGLVEVLDTSG